MDEQQTTTTRDREGEKERDTSSFKSEEKASQKTSNQTLRSSCSDPNCFPFDLGFSSGLMKVCVEMDKRNGFVTVVSKWI